MNCYTCYADKPPVSDGTYKVTFLILKTGAKLTKNFTFKDDAYSFVCKLKHSKTCKLLSYPLF